MSEKNGLFIEGFPNEDFQELLLELKTKTQMNNYRRKTVTVSLIQFQYIGCKASLLLDLLDKYLEKGLD